MFSAFKAYHADFNLGDRNSFRFGVISFPFFRQTRDNSLFNYYPQVYSNNFFLEFNVFIFICGWASFTFLTLFKPT